MLGYRDYSVISLNMERNNRLMTFFHKNPDSYFDMYTLKKVFSDFNVHEYLVKLEEDNVLIRSKIEITNKPVTHWKLHESIPSNRRYENQLQRNTFATRRNTQEELSDSADERPLKKIKFSTPNNYHIPVNHHVSVKPFCQITRPNDNTAEWRRPAPRRLVDHSDLSQQFARLLSIGEEKATKLNPHSPEFIPSSISLSKSTPYIPTSKSEGISTFAQRQSKSLDVIKSTNKPYLNEEFDANEAAEVNNLSMEFMTALTKNPVSVLHEFAQQRGMICDIDLLEIAGPSHKPKISMVVILNGRKFDTIVATNKKEGKRLAADAAIRTLISEGHFAERISRLSTRAAFKDGDINTEEIIASKNSISMLDKMASLVYNMLAKLMRKLTPSEGKALAGRKVVSALIMQDTKHDTFQVISLATGNRCISGDKISLQGKVVNDCHAEIVARRSFMLFLYHQLYAQIKDSQGSLDIFEDHIDNVKTSRRFKLKTHILFHLYISTAPCGDGALFCNRENGDKKRESEIVLSKEHKPTFEHQVQGLLRSKIEGGEGTIPVMNTRNVFINQTLDGILRGERLKTMSCSDKIVRWNFLGLQGALLSQLLEPIYITSISLGNLYNAGHLCRAVCCRLARCNNRMQKLDPFVQVNHPDLGYVYVGDLQREIDKSNELSLNWCYGLKSEILDGVTGQLTGIQEKLFPCSRISKVSLFHQYFKLLEAIHHPSSNQSLSYRQAKLLSSEYENKKLKLFEIFHKLEYGSWIRKPSEQNEFRDNLCS